MSLFQGKKLKNGQTAIEYLLVLAAATIIALVGFNTFLPRSQQQANEFFNKASRAIMGESAAKVIDFQANQIISDKVRTFRRNYP